MYNSKIYFIKEYILFIIILLLFFLFSPNVYANMHKSHLANHYSGRIINSELGDFMTKNMNLYYSPSVNVPTNMFMPDNAYYVSNTSYNNFNYKINNTNTYSEGYNFRVAPLVEGIITDKSSFYILPFFSGGWHWFRNNSENNSFTNKTSSYLGGLTLGAAYEINKYTDLRQSIGIKTGFGAGNINYDTHINGSFHKFYSITANYIAEIFYTIYAKFLPINIFSRYTYEYITGYTVSDFILEDINENRLMFGLALSPTLFSNNVLDLKLMLSASYEYNFNDSHKLKSNISQIDTTNHNTKASAVLRLQLPAANDKSISFDFGYSQHFVGLKGSTVFISISYGIYEHFNNSNKYINVNNTENNSSTKNNDTEIIKK